jgi:dolichol-phosphate mannosyltransferase
VRWIVAILVLRTAWAVGTPITPEEAYHWNFAAHLDWSYYDHPGMVAWSIALGRLLFGDTVLGVRFVPLLFTLGTLVLVGRLARRLYGESGATWAVILTATEPVTFFALGSGFPDSPLLFFWALSLTFVGNALEEGKGGWWIAAGASLGAMGLSKYTGAFFGVSVLFYLALSPRDRRWLATPWPYVASILAIALLFPVFTWNARHQWASFRFQGVERFQQSHAPKPWAGAVFLIEQWGAFLPLTLPLAAVATWKAARSPRPADRYLFWMSLPMPVFFFLLGWVRTVHLMWPMPAYLSVAVLMAGQAAGTPSPLSRVYGRLRPWLVGATVAAMLGFAVHIAVFLPFISPVQGLYGWDLVALRASELRKSMPEGTFYLGIGRKYTCESELAFRLRAPYEVHGRNLLGDTALQYDYWVDPRTLAGKDAVVVLEDGDRTQGMVELLKVYFTSFEKALTLTIPVGRRPLLDTPPLRFSLFQARGYRPKP